MSNSIKKLVRKALINEVSIDDMSLIDFNLKAIASDWLMSSPSSVIGNYQYEMQDDYSLSADDKEKILHDDDDDEIMESDRFKRWLKYDVEYRIDNFMYEIKDYINANGIINIWRKMTVDDNWIKRLPTSGNRLGIFWSFDENAAEAHWGGNETNKITIESEISQEYVNWDETIKLNIDPSIGEVEKEIRLFKNTPIIIKSLSINNEFVNIDSINKVFKA